MPKRIVILLIMMTALVSLLLVAMGCGTGDEGGVQRIHPAEVAVTGGAEINTDGGGGGGGGGGGAGTGACVFGVEGMCLQGTNLSTCNFYEGTFHAGQTCATYGYPTCTSFAGETWCF